MSYSLLMSMTNDKMTTTAALQIKKHQPERCPYCGKFLRGYRAHANRAARLEEATTPGLSDGWLGRYLCSACEKAKVEGC